MSCLFTLPMWKCLVAVATIHVKHENYKILCQNSSKYEIKSVMYFICNYSKKWLSSNHRHELDLFSSFSGFIFLTLLHIYSHHLSAATKTLKATIVKRIHVLGLGCAKKSQDLKYINKNICLKQRWHITPILRLANDSPVLL